MKLKRWSVLQENSEVCDDGVVTLVTSTTIANVNADKLIKWIKAYDPTYDMDAYNSVMQSHKEEMSICDEFGRKTPMQLIEMCDRFYNIIHQYRDRTTDAPMRLRKRLKIGINVLQEYGIYWCPPDQRYAQLIDNCFERVLTNCEMLELRKYLQSLSVDDLKSVINKMWETADEIKYHNKHEAEQKREGQR